LPVGPYEVRQFVLCNIRGKAVPRVSTGVLSAFRVEITEADRITPHWSLKVYRYKGAWNIRADEWKNGNWVEEESLPVAFKESFHVLGKAEDYYFVTRSGKLFAARKPARGKTRTMQLLWDDPSRPIRTLITDADSGRSFLFCKAKAGEKPCFFELDGKPKPLPYDPNSVISSKAQEPLRNLLICARVLVAQGKIKAR
jgi:hypothetical protein